MPYYVYFISDGEYIKIGIAGNIEKRLYTLQTANARRLTLIRSLETKDESIARLCEYKLHKQFSDFRAMGEWFSIKWHDAESVVSALQFEMLISEQRTRNHMIQAKFNHLVDEDLEQNFPPITRRFIFRRREADKNREIDSTFAEE